MSSMDRRQMLKSAVAGSAALLASGELLKAEGQSEAAPARKGRIHQSACKWCYPKLSLDDLCKAGAAMGLKGIDLLGPEEYEVPKKYGLVCSMGYAGAGDIPNGLNRVENQF